MVAVNTGNMLACDVAFLVLVIALALINFLQTIARGRQMKFIFPTGTSCFCHFCHCHLLAAYIPLLEKWPRRNYHTRYYMHQGVGMWFMLLHLGIVYYFSAATVK
jgi:cytochrome c oxidase cbb3-type subunit 1